MKKVVFLFLVLVSGFLGTHPVKGEPVEEIITYHNPQVQGHYHFFDRNDSFAVYYEPPDFDIFFDFEILGFWFDSGIVGRVNLSLCEDDTTNPQFEHFPGEVVYDTTVVFRPGSGTVNDTLRISQPVERSDARGIWFVIPFEVDNIPFHTSGTSPPPYRNLVHNKTPPYWWSDIDDWSVGLLVRYEPTGIGPEGSPPSFPRAVVLHQNAPNPFNPTTWIRFELPETRLVRLFVYDLRGRLVKNLINGEERVAGSYQVTWNGQAENGEKVSSGIYFLKLQAGEEIKTRKMILFK